MKNLLVTMSGGTTSVINATLAGIIHQAQKSKDIDKVYAGFPGILGFMEDNLLDLTNITPDELEIVKLSPGSASIGTTRTKIFNAKDADELRRCFKKHNIEYFVNIGGNGTIKQTKAIASFISDVKMAAVPKTVDNDLGDAEFEDLWFTPGFPSCVNFWYHKMHMLDNESRGAHSHDRILVAQTFGRETGFIVGALRMFDPDRSLPIVLLIPEDQQPLDKVMSHIDNTLSKHNRAIVGICEGYNIKKYNYEYDLTGQRMYGSSHSTAAQEMVNACIKNNMQARGYNPTFDQRQNFNYTLDNDVQISYNIGEKVIKNLISGESHFFQSFSTNGTHMIPLDEIGNYSRVLKEEWIRRGEFDVSDKYIDYLSEFTPISPRRKLFSSGQIL